MGRRRYAAGLLLLSALGLVILAATGARASSGAPAGGQAPATGAALEPEARRALLERWNRMSPESRARAVERFERFQELSPEQRAILSERARRLQRSANLIYDLLTPEEQRRLDRLEPEKRKEILLALATQEEHAQRMRLREKLGGALGEPIDPALEGRGAFLDELHQRQELLMGRALQRLGGALGLQPSAIEELEALPLDERKSEFLRLAKDLSIEGVDRSDLPPGLTAWRWERMRALPPEEFFAAVLNLRERNPGFEPLWVDGAAGGPKEPEQPTAEERAHPDEPGAPMTSGTADAPGAPVAEARPTSELVRATMRAVRAALQLDESDLIDLASLPLDERRDGMVELRRRRVVELLRGRDLLPPERIDEIEARPDEWFLKTVRELTRPPSSWREAPPILRELAEHLGREH